MTAEAAARRAVAAWAGGEDVTLTPLGDGHINDTWRVHGPACDGVLQRISGAVFPDPAAVAAKVAMVVRHLEGSPLVRVPGLLQTRTGALWQQDTEGVWRLWEHLPARTLQVLENEDQARAAGLAFGRFQRALAGLDEPVPDPIAHFMRLNHYLAALDEAGARSRDEPAFRPLFELVDARRGLGSEFGAVDRLVHGDCKVNNLLFAHGADTVTAVVDLDTVMRGHWGWDFGDLVRSAAASGPHFDVRRFAAVAEGFLTGSGVGSDPDLLVAAPRYVTLMLAVRFLTDHLQGDRYFRVGARGDNLRRARAQFDLLLAMEAAQDASRRALERMLSRRSRAPD